MSRGRPYSIVELERARDLLPDEPFRFGAFYRVSYHMFGGRWHAQGLAAALCREGMVKRERLRERSRLFLYRAIK